GAINKDVTFDGGLGLNSVVLDDVGAKELNASYAVTAGELTRTGIKPNAASEKVDVHVLNAQYLGLNTTGNSGANLVAVSALYNNPLTLTLGGTNNSVVLDETTGGAGDIVRIAAAAGVTRHNNSLVIQDNDTFANFLSSGPATYTLAADHAAGAITNARI